MTERPTGKMRWRIATLEDHLTYGPTLVASSRKESFVLQQEWEVDEITVSKKTHYYESLNTTRLEWRDVEVAE